MAALAYAALCGLPLLAPVAVWLTPRVRYRPFPWDQSQREDDGGSQ
jgi:hypothetical protein